MPRVFINQCPQKVGQRVWLFGWVHQIRELGGVNFLILRDKTGLFQVVVNNKEQIAGLGNESVVKIFGLIVKEKRAPMGVEMHLEKIEVLSLVKEELPLEINKQEIPANLETILKKRTLAIRNPKIKAIFKVQAEILEGFREFFRKQGFVEIQTPKIVSEGLETGGAEMFSLKYFGKTAYLAQSPQMYKQIMVSAFERVFETAYVYRAEPHNTSRHLNEYFSLDVEMGFISGLEDLLKIHEAFIHYLLRYLSQNTLEELNLLKVKLPEKKKIPRLKFSEVLEILEKNYQQKCRGALDLEPKWEELISQYAQKKWGSDFVFITHYPSPKRPFYTYNDPQNPRYTLSFDCLFRGLEISTGGQRLHLYQDYLKKMKEKGLDPKNFSEYLEIFKFGMPPHGGFGLGLERLTTKLLGLKNIREASLFPRDMTRLKP